MITQAGTMLGFLFCIIIGCFGTADCSTNSDIYIEEIVVENNNIFLPEESQGLVANVTNALHWPTRDYYIRDLISLTEGEYNDVSKLLESERVLRNTGLFTSVKIELEETETGSYIAYVSTEDKFSLEPAILFGLGGGVKNFGGRLAEYNFLGTGSTVSVEGLYTSENDIGLSGGGQATIPNIFRTLTNFNISVNSSDVITSQSIGLEYPFRYLEPSVSWGISGFRSFGRSFYYSREQGNFEQANANVINPTAFYSIALERESMVYFTSFLELNYADRGEERFRRMMDNSGSILFSFSSSSKNFTTIENADYYQVQDLQLGGYGEAIIGKIFPIAEGGDNLYYIAAKGEQSYYDGTNYLFGYISGGSGFQTGNPRYTFQESNAKAFHKAGDFIFANEFSQITAWNWPAQRQLVLDFQSGLRGYDANQFAGDNRIINNTEVRWMPDYQVWIFNLGAAAFLDMGTTWETGEPLSETQWKQSAGLGIRIFNSKSAGVNSVLRLDAAWNFETRSFGGIIITTGHTFSLIRNHPFRLPEMLGRGFDEF